MARVRDRAKVWGPLLDPHAVWLLERGVKTLAVRMEAHELRGQPIGERVRRLIGIAHPDDRERLERQARDGIAGIRRYSGPGSG
jgi:acyl-CoA hydrolase